MHYPLRKATSIPSRSDSVTRGRNQFILSALGISLPVCRMEPTKLWLGSCIKNHGDAPTKIQLLLKSPSGRCAVCSPQRQQSSINCFCEINAAMTVADWMSRRALGYMSCALGSEIRRGRWDACDGRPSGVSCRCDRTNQSTLPLYVSLLSSNDML